jgi:gamma-glutamyl-gamma-aminobutyrate hydrolase PuuD
MEINPPLTQRQIDKMNAEVDKQLKDKTFTVEDMNKALDVVIEHSAKLRKLLTKMTPELKPDVNSAHKQFVKDATKTTLLIKRALYHEIADKEDVEL